MLTVFSIGKNKQNGKGKIKYGHSTEANNEMYRRLLLIKKAKIGKINQQKSVTCYRKSSNIDVVAVAVVVEAELVLWWRYWR